MRNRKIYDISMELSGQTPEWPGDIPFQYELAATIEQSGSVNVGKVVTSTHIGTHVDAPFHYDNDGIKIDELPLDYYLTTAQVIDVRGKAEITRTDLPDVAPEVTAILLKSDSWEDRTKFPETWPLFDPTIAEWMAEQEIKLLGVDVPSVDAKTSKDLPMHMAMSRNNRYILEGLVLNEVPEGIYQLVALPLKIKGAEGSPVRAVLHT
ncbi:cyclase family protein [Planococcus sp. 1R117A]|uniref:cyclase family protein n=1 Tax=Planococcus sp. 1R117A TaxID=3447020 RepID=UPI003EDC13E7